MKERKNIQRQIDLTVLFLLLLWPEERKKKTTETPHTVYLHVALEKATVKKKGEDNKNELVGTSTKVTATA